MPSSGTSSPYEVEKHAAQVDLFNVLPGLATVPEETDITDTDRRSYMSFESWDTSFSTLKEGEYTSTAGESEFALPGLPNEPPRSLPTSIGDIHVPANLLRTVSSTKTWRPNLELPDDNGLTAQDIVSPQIVSPSATRGRVQSVTLGQLQRSAADRSDSTLLPDSSIRNLRKSSVPIGQELNRIPALPHDAGQPWSTMRSAGHTAPTRTNSYISPTASRRPTTARPSLQPRYTGDSGISPAVSARDFAATTRPGVTRSASSARRNLAFFTFGRRSSAQTPVVYNNVVDMELGPNEPVPPQTARPSVIEMMPDFIQVIAGGVATAANAVADAVRRPTLVDAYERAKIRTVQLQRKPWVMKLFEYSIYLLLVCFVYFVLVGRPLWNGAVWWLWWVVEFVISGGWAITIGLAIL
jgi:hypothetical protein